MVDGRHRERAQQGSPTGIMGTTPAGVRSHSRSELYSVPVDLVSEIMHAVESSWDAPSESPWVAPLVSDVSDVASPTLSEQVQAPSVSQHAVVP